ncbi:MAG: hypothetical protein HY231_23785 [Acidobacteria bacterium]|nr:hypothetical protein [Acidobacteriota bacterium]
MSVPQDDLLGVIYISPDYFIENARMFGCAKAIQGLDANSITPLLAIASRMIDAYVGRDFAGGEIHENHKFDLNSRRIKINRPPLQTLISYRLRTAPGLVSSFAVTPVTDDGENNISFGSIYYNRQENYLEVASLAMASSMTAQLVSLGISEPQVEIVYTSYADVPKEVITATGYMAAHLINDSAANQVIAPGLASVKADDVEVRRGSSVSAKGSREDSIPPIVKTLLRGVSRIAIG